jgi:hypothetical protein
LAEQGSTAPSLTQQLDSIQTQKTVLANSRAEGRHIWPTDVFTNFGKFTGANLLYELSVQGRPLKDPLWVYASFVILLVAVAYCIFMWRQYRWFLIFSLIFLTINYILFARNNDQQRYQLFIAVFLVVYSLILVSQFARRIKINPFIFSISIAGIGIMMFVPLLISDVSANEWWVNSQLYSPSIGGMASVQEVGTWVHANSRPEEKLGQQCGNETEYYANRQTIGDWRIYFLSDSALHQYLKSSGIKYYVLNESQEVPDDKWASICWVPNSFVVKLGHNYTLAFSSKSQDIFVYKVN